jgi:hypothetical protein
MVTGAASSILAEEVSAEVSLEGAAEPEKSPETWKAPYRGTTITYRNVATAISLKEDAELGYNPYYAMAFSLDPRWWIGDVFNTALSLTLTRELTNSDSNTYSGETELSDFSATFGASNFVTIPVLEIGISANLGFVAPTSKISRARTMILAIKPGLSLSRKFDVLSGIGLSYNFSYTKSFHEFTTSQQESSHITGCVSTLGGCDSYMNTGVRNSSWGIANSFSLSIQFVEWLGVGANVGILHSFLYEQEEAGFVVDEVTGYEYETSDGLGGDDNDVRYAMLYGLEITVSPIQALEIGIGAETYNSQLAPDSTYQQPFFNRYTAIYLDLRLSLSGLVSQLTSKEE